MSIDLALSLALFAAFMVYAARRLLVLLHVFQQEEYDNKRFAYSALALKPPFPIGRDSIWVFPAFLICTVLLIGWYTDIPSLRFPIVFFWGFVLLFLAALDHSPFKSKKSLSMTMRAWRIYLIGISLCFFVFLPLALLGKPWLWLFVFVFMLINWHFVLYASNLLLSPYEKHIQRRYWREAHEKLTRLNRTRRRSPRRAASTPPWASRASFGSGWSPGTAISSRRWGPTASAPSRACAIWPRRRTRL